MRLMLLAAGASLIFTVALEMVDASIPFRIKFVDTESWYTFDFPVWNPLFNIIFGEATVPTSILVQHRGGGEFVGTAVLRVGYGD